MFRREVYKKLLEWKGNRSREEALLVEGARRVGKSAVVEEFAKREYETYILIDFSQLPKAVREIFEEKRDDLDTFFMMISAYYRVRLVERKSLIVFDEIQRYPIAREMIKYLVAEGRYDYVETGSLISIKKNVEGIVIPSEEAKMPMGPMDFEEFCWAMGEEVLAGLMRRAFEELEPLPDALHRRAMRLWREYMLVGGMPQAVSRYTETRDFGEVDHVKRNILALYADDTTKFAGRDASRVRGIFAQMPGQLSKHEKKFTLSSVSEDARARDYASSFFWLGEAKIVNICRNVTDPSVGLALTSDEGSVKCYMGDTGLLVSQAFADRDATPNEVYRDILFERLSINEGMLVENAVAQQLWAAGYSLHFFSRYEKGNARASMDIDFLVVREYDHARMKPRISLIEVKPGKRYGTSSLDKFKGAYGRRVGTQYVLHPKGISVKGDRVALPLYLAHVL